MSRPCRVGYRLLACLALMLANASAEVCEFCHATCQLRTNCESYAPFPVNLRWLKSAQFAGYYAAKALGYWEDECLAVSLRPVVLDYDKPNELWRAPPDTRATMPWYKSHLVHAITLEQDVIHVSQIFRRSALRWWTSPVNNPERTLSITSYGQLDRVVQCSPGFPRLDLSMYALLRKYNRTGCNYQEPLSGEFIECVGTENIRFIQCGFGVDEVVGDGERTEAAHIMHGMVYDQLGSMLSTVKGGRLFVEGRDFRVFSPEDDGIPNLEDGISVNSTWLGEPGNEETLVRFLKGLHRGWIYCRDNPDACAELVTPPGSDPAAKLHQRYQMHEVNKLIWPSSGGIGLHPEQEMRYSQQSALAYGLINRTVPFSEHTSDKYVLLANQRLVEDGYDVEGAFFSGPSFQSRVAFCLNKHGVPIFCRRSSQDSSEPSKEAQRSSRLALILSLLAVIVFGLVAAIALWTHYRNLKKRRKGSPCYTSALMRRNPPGMLGTGNPVTIVVTDIESSTALWAAYPEEMMQAQVLHDQCLRERMHECFGYEVHTEGDSFTVAFHEAEDALRWCSTVQTSLEDLAWPSVFTEPASPPLPASVGRQHDTPPSTPTAANSPSKLIAGGRHLIWKQALSAWLSGESSNTMEWTTSPPAGAAGTAPCLNKSSRRLSAYAVSNSSRSSVDHLSMRTSIECGAEDVAAADKMALDLQEFYGQMNVSCRSLNPLASRRRTSSRRRFRAQNLEVGNSFRGLRVRMGVHTATVHDIRRHAVTNRVMYDDALVEKAKLVSETGCGGQVLLTSDTVAAVSASAETAKHSCILHMGCHQLSEPSPLSSQETTPSVKLSIDDDVSNPLPPGEKMDDAAQHDFAGSNRTELFMLLPYPLLKRVFCYPPLTTEAQISGGYFQAPSKDKVTICFTGIQGLEGMSATLPAQTSRAVELICNCVRSLLSEHEGYECEEHKGSFMLAFHSPTAAVTWATAVQEALLYLPWPDDILSHPSCETWQMDNQVIFHGPRFKIGLASGHVVKKIPNPSTGRADYFGPLLNHAARILSKAAGGQVLVDSSTWEAIRAESGGALGTLMAVDLGEFTLKGVENAVRLHQVSDEESAVSLRSFPVTRCDALTPELLNTEFIERRPSAAPFSSVSMDSHAQEGSRGTSWRIASSSAKGRSPTPPRVGRRSMSLTDVGTLMRAHSALATGLQATAGMMQHEQQSCVAIEAHHRSRHLRRQSSMRVDSDNCNS